jgi:hypothetical protein
MGMSPFGRRKPSEGPPPGMTREGTGKHILKGRRVAGEMQLLENEANATAEIAWSMETLLFAPIGDRARIVWSHPRQDFQ